MLSTTHVGKTHAHKYTQLVGNWQKRDCPSQAAEWVSLFRPSQVATETLEQGTSKAIVAIVMVGLWRTGLRSIRYEDNFDLFRNFVVCTRAEATEQTVALVFEQNKSYRSPFEKETQVNPVSCTRIPFGRKAKRK